MTGSLAFSKGTVLLVKKTTAVKNGGKDILLQHYTLMSQQRIGSHNDVRNLDQRQEAESSYSRGEAKSDSLWFKHINSNTERRNKWQNMLAVKCRRPVDHTDVLWSTRSTLCNRQRRTCWDNKEAACLKLRHFLWRLKWFVTVTITLWLVHFIYLMLRRHRPWLTLTDQDWQHLE